MNNFAQTGISFPSWIEVSGFKSIKDPAKIHLRPLTLLAGANSSGKSSFMQPLLLLKQSMEVPFDPDPLHLDGTHVSFNSLGQFLAQGESQADSAEGFDISFGGFLTSLNQPVDEEDLDVKLRFERQNNGDEKLVQKTFFSSEKDVWLEANENYQAELKRFWGIRDVDPVEAKIIKQGLYWHIAFMDSSGVEPTRFLPMVDFNAPLGWIQQILHYPGLRGHRERTFLRTKFNESDGRIFVTGPAHQYTGSLLAEWQKQIKYDLIPAKKRTASERLAKVSTWLHNLGLSSGVFARITNASELELRVGRTLSSQKGIPADFVDIADVGFGTSQILPVLVGLAVASPGQMVLIEQPELHLHPRAQLAMGGVLAEAAQRGVIVVVETHSQLILRALQTVVAKGILSPDEVGLHWFSRDEQTGWSKVIHAVVKNDGSFGDWPVDFPDVFSMADQDFIDAVFARGDGE